MGAIKPKENLFWYKKKIAEPVKPCKAHNTVKSMGLRLCHFS